MFPSWRQGRETSLFHLCIQFSNISSIRKKKGIHEFLNSKFPKWSLTFTRFLSLPVFSHSKHRQCLGLVTGLHLTAFCWPSYSSPRAPKTPLREGTVVLTASQAGRDALREQRPHLLCSHVHKAGKGAARPRKAAQGREEGWEQAGTWSPNVPMQSCISAHCPARDAACSNLTLAPELVSFWAFLWHSASVTGCFTDFKVNDCSEQPWEVRGQAPSQSPAAEWGLREIKAADRLLHN